ncbi:hypothetical protein CRYUN_Cryun37aG0056000 [Craigia yunnanensis]
MEQRVDSVDDDLNIINGNAKPRRKGIRIDTKSMEQRVDNVDYISQLPEHNIHQIIGLLLCKKDAARTSVLSKRWRDIWASFSNLVFDQRKFHGQLRGLKMLSEVQIWEITNVEVFGNYIDNILQRCVEQKDRSIQKFALRMTHYNSGLTTRMDCFQLKTLVLRECKQLEEADIDTPNLILFEYKGDKIPFSSLCPSSLKEAKLYFKPSRPEVKPRFHYGDDHTPWFARLQEFLEKFDYSRGLKLVACSAKLVHKKLIAREESSCCTYNVPCNKCWRHFRDDVKTENLVNSKSTSD